MKTKTLILLYGIVAVLALGVILATNFQNADSGSSAKFERGNKPFAKLPADDIATIELKEGDVTTTLVQKEGAWTVSERQNYPANLGKMQSLIRSINELSVTQSLEAGESYDARFGLDTTVSLKKSDGSVFRSLKIGKDITNGQQNQMAMMMGGSNANGCYIRLPEDEGIVYATNTVISDASASPKNWLAKDFIQVKKITEITLSKPGKPDEVEWKVTRPNAMGKFALEGDIPAGKMANASALSSLENQFGYASFEDVLSPSAGEGLSDVSKARRATILTEEGFTYTINIAPKTVKGTENHLLTVQVEGYFVTERVRPEAETVEEGDSADEHFATQLAEKKEKLAKEKELEGIYFEVTKLTIQNLFKSRDELLTEMAAATPSPSTTTPAIPFRR